MTKRFHLGLLLAITFTVIGVVPAFAQDSDGVIRKTKVKVIKPADLPTQEESEIPQVLKNTTALPRPLKLNELVAARDQVVASMVRIVAIYPPPNRFQRTRIMVEGQAVWLSAEPSGQRPVLVSPYHWLEKAEEIYAIPWTEDQINSDGKLPMAKRTSHKAAVTNHSVKHFYRNEKDRVRLKVISGDIHRNLVALSPEKVEAKSKPKTDWFKTATNGLTFFNVRQQSATLVYALSPLVSPNPRQTGLAAASDAELIYYLQSDFPGALGAPIFTPDGAVIGLTSMPHPRRSGITLAIPPLALRAYVERLQGLVDPALVTAKDDKAKP